MVNEMLAVSPHLISVSIECEYDEAFIPSRTARQRDRTGSAAASLGLTVAESPWRRFAPLVPAADWSMCDPVGSKGQDLNETLNNCQALSLQSITGHVRAGPEPQ